MNQLNMGCGYEKLRGFVNLDSEKKRNPDLLWNLDKYPYPFKDNTFDYVRASNIMEHIIDIKKSIEELHRITKETGSIQIIVPHYNHIDAYTDVTHIHFFSPDSFDVFVKNSNACHFSDKKFRTIKKDIIPTGLGKFIPKRLLWSFGLIVGNLISRIDIVLQPIKEVEEK